MFDMSADTRHHRNPHHVPTRYQHRLCMCDEPGTPLFDGKKRPAHVNSCSTCLKPYRWNLRHCTECGEWFIKDFRSRISNCARHTKCWKCLESTPVCCEFAANPTNAIIFGPLGLNPREISQEEKDAAYDVPSVFD